MEDDFYKFTDKLIKDNNLPSEVKNTFFFLTLKHYAMFSPVDKFIIYEDWWLRKPEVVKSKILSILKISKRIYGRHCEVRKINKTEADIFLNNNHIYGSTVSKVKYGIYYEGNLYAVATFASQRQFRDGSRSAELLRYCSKNGFSVIGGLDKLLKAYIKTYTPDSIMTYVNKDWGRGEAFLKLGFEKIAGKPPITFYVNIKTGKRIPEKHFTDFENIDLYLKINNKGSLKLVKKL